MNNFSFNHYNDSRDQRPNEPRQQLDEQSLAELTLAAFYGYLSPHDFIIKLSALKDGQAVRYVRPELARLDGSPVDAKIVVVEKEIFFKVKKPYGLELISGKLNKEFLIELGYIVAPNFSMIQGDI